MKKKKKNPEYIQVKYKLLKIPTVYAAKLRSPFLTYPLLDMTLQNKSNEKEKRKRKKKLLLVIPSRVLRARRLQIAAAFPLQAGW